MTIMSITMMTLKVSFTENDQIHLNDVYHVKIHDDDELNNQNENVLTLLKRNTTILKFIKIKKKSNQAYKKE